MPCKTQESEEKVEIEGVLTLRSKFCSTFSGTLGSSSAEPNSNVSITVLALIQFQMG